MKKAFIAIAIAAFAQTASARIAGGPHDLSASGPNAAKYGTAPAAATPCSFCHAVHKANTDYTGAALWNRPTLAPVGGWQMYPSTSITGAIDTIPAAASLTCLSCHEGSAALGVTFSSSPTNILTGGTTTVVDPIAGRALNIGADLRNDHPVSFVYAAVLNVFPTPTNEGASGANISGMPLYGVAYDRMECATCHDAHADVTAALPKLLRVAPASICGTCHLNK